MLASPDTHHPTVGADSVEKSPALEVVMVSATFGDEMWSARGIGKQRLEKTIAVRQGMNVSLVLENPKDKGSFKEDTKRQRELMSRMQKQLQAEVTEEKKKGWFNF